MARWRIAVLVALAVPLVLVGLASLGWTLDTRNDGGQVRRGAMLAGTEVSGMSRDELDDVTARFAEQLPKTKVTIEADHTTLNTTAGDLGVRVDAPATVDAVMAEGRDDPGVLAPIRWARSLLTDRRVDVSLTVDREAAAATLRELQGPRATDPVEPTLKSAVEAVSLAPGAPGRGIDIDDVLTKLPSDIGRVGQPIVIHTKIRTTPPSLRDEAVQPLVDKANAVT